MISNNTHLCRTSTYLWLVGTNESASWQEKWNTPAGNVPSFTETKEVKKGDRVFVLIFFVNPKLGKGGGADVTCDLEVIRPDKTASIKEEAVVCFNGAMKVRHNLPSNQRSHISSLDQSASLNERIQAEREQLFKAISIVECCKYANATLLEVDAQEYILGVFDALCDILNSSAGELGCIADECRCKRCKSTQ